MEEADEKKRNSPQFKEKKNTQKTYIVNVTVNPKIRPYGRQWNPYTNGKREFITVGSTNEVLSRRRNVQPIYALNLTNTVFTVNAYPVICTCGSR